MKNTILAVFFLAFSTLCSSFVSPSVASYQKKTSLLASNQETSSYIASDTELLDYDSGMTVRETSLTKNSHSVSLAFSVDGKNSANSYIFGYYGKKEEDSFYPLTCTYQVKDSNGKVTTLEKENSLISSNAIYDGVGELVGYTYQNYSFDLEIPTDASFVEDSIVIYNVFPAVAKEDGSLSFDKTNPLKISTFSRKAAMMDLDPYFSFALEKYSTYLHYSTFTVSYTHYPVTLYQKYRSTYYNRNKDSIDAGKVVVTTKITGIGNSFFLLGYEDGSEEENSIGENSLTTTETIPNGTSQAIYLLKGIKTDGLKSFSLAGLSITMTLQNVLADGTKKDLPNTSLSYRIGKAYFEMPEDNIHNVGPKRVFDILLFAALIYIVWMAAGIVALFFYRKKKYRNDEFRRVNPKRYFLRSLIPFFGGLVALLDILYIAFRSTLFANSLTIYNPLDNPIVILSILLIFFLGYGIKALISFIKDSKARKQREKAGLDKNPVESDDGTK